MQALLEGPPRSWEKVPNVRYKYCNHLLYLYLYILIHIICIYIYMYYPLVSQHGYRVL
jgi:hypothetical protein